MTRWVGMRRRVAALPRTPAEAKATALLIGILRSRGWHRSVNEQASVASDGMPTPWWTYAATEWMALVLRPHHRVFEFGSGNSTLWLSKRVEAVHTVEHDAAWASRLSSNLPPNVQLSFVPTSATDADGSDDDPYLAPIDEPHDRSYDLVIIDGMARNACVARSMSRVGVGGMILLDDADRLAYRPAHTLLSGRGFGRVDFFGPKPGAGHMSTTSVFCRGFDLWANSLDPPPVSGY